ncbi:alpha/beta hydrolase [Yinghuangia seranimata]|uniref:alpha/beta hydrolase n=1 Tax=Yinghuangia seranimata TaxID=408067 RepID=UPI00248B11CF|nr:alpha/beta fold hydrolase [Yinghuangia seranimata]MDI2127550.1 alpha/beta fold hydrolase [Yinghuangia seranimata]
MTDRTTAASSSRMPHLALRPAPAGAPELVLLVLPGGRARDVGPASRRHLAYQRMAHMGRELQRRSLTTRDYPTLDVAVLRYRLRGWNGAEAHPVADARWALETVRNTYPQTPVMLLGHSMGGRTALRVADLPGVAAVAALAPWTPQGEPLPAVGERPVLLVHGLADNVTDPSDSLAYARRLRATGASVCRVEVPGAGHAMVRGHEVWTDLVAAFTALVVGRTAGPMADALADAGKATDDDGLRLQLPPA